MYPNLKAEFTRRGLIYEDVAPAIGVTVPTFSQKMTGKYPFTLNEAKTIQREVLKTDLSIEYLFEEAS